MREASGGPERWQQVKSVLDGSLGKSPEERPAWLDEACARDEELRGQVALPVEDSLSAGLRGLSS